MNTDIAETQTMEYSRIIDDNETHEKTVHDVNVDNFIWIWTSRRRKRCGSIKNRLP